MHPQLANVETKTIRQTNQRARRRQNAISNVIEQLDVFSVCLLSYGLLEDEVVQPAGRYDSLRREQAKHIVDAVIALMQGEI